jgi:hypothetical protein
MSVSTYNKVMKIIDKIELTLNDIALEVGHPSFEEFFGEE